MFIVNDHIQRRLLNEYGGSEQKETVLLDDGQKYLLKKPDGTREKSRREELSYINNAYSEYISCHIAKILGLPVQETILGQYKIETKYGVEKTKTVCLCKDVRAKGEKMLDFAVIALGFNELSTGPITFKKQTALFHAIKEQLRLSDTSEQALLDFYYKLFVFDAFIGNTDRHNGNVAILLNEDGNFSRIAPIYDCGSSLLPLISDEEIPTIPLASAALSIPSVICDASGNHIRYDNFLPNTTNEHIKRAVRTLICKIDRNEIDAMIDSVDGIPEIRKQFYKDILQLRYEKILIPALEQTMH